MIIFSLIITSCINDTTAPGSKITEDGFVCPEPTHREDLTSSRINLYLPENSVPLEILECFKLQYNVKVVVDEFDNSEQMFAVVSASGKKYDLVLARDMFIPLLAGQGFLKKLDKLKIPSVENINSTYLNLEFDPLNQYSIPWRAGMTGLAFNAAAGKTAPQSWGDLWNDEYSGRILYPNDQRTTLAVVLLALGYDVNTTDPVELAFAKDKLAELFLKVRLFESSSTGKALVNGEADLGILDSEEAIFAAREFESIHYIFPSEGAILWQDNWVLLNEAQNTDVAYAFLNYVLRPDVSWMLLDEFRYTNPNSAALKYAQVNYPEIYTSYMNSQIVNPPDGAFLQGHRILDVGETTGIYDDIWVEVIVGD